MGTWCQALWTETDEARVANRHLPVFLLNSTRREPAAFSETEPKRNKILLKAAVHLLTGGFVPRTSDRTRVTHKPASVAPGRVGG